jgi:soluble lytic murein transglycosylase-like protein
MTIGEDVPFGLNEKRTVRSAHATFNFTYAADFPGIGVISSRYGGASGDVVELIDEHLNGHGQVIYEEARRTGLELALACALVQQESLGRNIFGHDWGQQFADRLPFAHLPVTEARVQALLRHVRNGGTSNGVGLTQLTYPLFIQEAEKIGGAHIPRNQCRVGFRLLASYVDKYNYMEALGAYNAGETNRRAGITNDYAGDLAEKHRVWKGRLGGRVHSGASAATPP